MHNLRWGRDGVVGKPSFLDCVSKRFWAAQRLLTLDTRSAVCRVPSVRPSLTLGLFFKFPLAIKGVSPFQPLRRPAQKPLTLEGGIELIVYLNPDVAPSVSRDHVCFLSGHPELEWLR